MVGLHISYDRSFDRHNKIHNGCHKYIYSIPLSLPLCYLDLDYINTPCVYNYSCICFAGSVSEWYLHCHYKEKTEVQWNACSFQIIQFRSQRFWFFYFQRLGNLSCNPSKEIFAFWLCLKNLISAWRTSEKSLCSVLVHIQISLKALCNVIFQGFLPWNLDFSCEDWPIMPLWGEVLHSFSYCILLIYGTDQCIY